MSREPRPKLFAAAKSLENTGREELATHFYHLEDAIRCEWGRLKDKDVARQERRSDLAASLRKVNVLAPNDA
jgi:hypothetical protein